jgi:hypothetical protein
LFAPSEKVFKNLCAQRAEPIEHYSILADKRVSVKTATKTAPAHRPLAQATHT